MGVTQVVLIDSGVEGCGDRRRTGKSISATVTARTSEGWPSHFMLRRVCRVASGGTCRSVGPVTCGMVAGQFGPPLVEQECACPRWDSNPHSNPFKGSRDARGALLLTWYDTAVTQLAARTSARI